VTPEQVLQQYWGYSSFRAPQREIIESILQGYDTVGILPTGAGKSVCFQVPALVQEGLCIVVSPLIALMQDQVAQLKQKGVAALAIHSGLGHREIDVLLDNCVYGQQKFLYVSPERLQTELFQERFARMNVNLIAIDEAHCISQWGYDFRPPYLQIAELRTIKPKVPMVAVTASATKLVKDDIIRKLQLQSPHVFQISFARTNLSLVVRKAEAKEKKLLEILRKVPGASIVYVRSRKATLTLDKFLKRNGVSSTHYHAGLPHVQREEQQQAWLQNKCRVMVATNAFGMGINKPDVRTVLHMDLPESLESYYQEAGRAGRDGKRAYATIIFHELDAQSLRQKTEQSQPRLEYLQKVYQALANYFQLAVGSGQAESFDFDLESFCDRFSMKPATVYPALKKLEEVGLIQFNESFYRPSQVHLSIDKKKIYEFQVANERFDALIKMLLRLYGGELYSDFVTISESQLAHASKQTIGEVEMQLKQLHNLHLLVYESKKDTPQITFVLARQDADRLPIDTKLLENRRQLHLKKTKSMIDYTEQSHRCRMQVIQEYFDEVTYQSCGICDVCLRKKKTDTSALYADYYQQIRYLLQTGPLSVEDLETQIAPTAKEIMGEVIQEMLENGELYYDQYWLVHLARS
jgi:ATP-dependent DNA helicase RecQ